MTSIALPVLLPRIANQNWSCHSCGDCCRTLVGHVTLEERTRILEQDWAQKLGSEPLVWAGRSWVLNKRADSACVFLDENNRCRIHAEYGESAKPLACRIFPFSVRRSSGGWQASLRFDCPSVTSNKGAPLSTHRGWLEHLVAELPDQAPATPETVLLDRALVAQADEIESVKKHMAEWFAASEFSMNDRLVGAARLLTTLTQAKLRNVRGERFTDLLDILMETVRADLPLQLDDPTVRQEGMLRQVVLAHAEHVSLSQLRSGMAGRFQQRWRQLKSARQMLAGVGDVPVLPGIHASVPFSAVSRVEPAREEAIRINDLLLRYLTARVHGQSVFGAGYYGWTVLEGYSALLLAVSAIGWLGRLIAAANGAAHVRFSDAAVAMGIIDRAATRLPALGTWTERNRLVFLHLNDGLIRLVHRYRLTSD